MNSKNANCNNLSPEHTENNTNSNTNNWNNDSWADGEFEPIEENTGQCYNAIKLAVTSFMYYILAFRQSKSR